MAKEMSTTPIPANATGATDAPPLTVDFTWKKFKANVTQGSPDGAAPEPYMLVDFKMLKPHLEFKSLRDDSVVGTGSVHTISIHPDYTLRGHSAQLRALSKFRTKYTHLSQNYGSTSEPMEMTWTTSSNFVDWDFICSDARGEPVARFNSSWWALRKLGVIEFLGDKAWDEKAREEIVVVGLTLWYCMIVRMNNIFNFFGAIFASTGPIKRDEKDDLPLDDVHKGKVD